MKKYSVRLLALYVAILLAFPSQFLAAASPLFEPSSVITVSNVRLQEESLVSPVVNSRPSLTGYTAEFWRDRIFTGGADTPPWNAPYAEGKITLEDGRSLGYGEYGYPKGAPLLFMAENSRHEPQAYAIDGLERQGVRLIVLEHPGIGFSTPAPDQKLEDWPKDVLQFVNKHLGPTKRFGILGNSASSFLALVCMTDALLKPLIFWKGLYAPAKLTSAWPFQLDDIAGPVHIWHGTDDDQVPYAIGEELARTLPEAVLQPLKGHAHRAIVNIFPAIIKEFKKAVPMRVSARAGEYPFTGGIHPEMYTGGKLWTMRQYAGFSTAEDTNLRYKDLLRNGQTGLSVAFDLLTQMGFDPGSLLFPGEEGRVGVSIASLHDMEILFKDIDLGVVSTSMTINATAAILLAMYVAVAKKRGIPLTKLRGTIQNDILKEFIARNTHIYLLEPSMRLITDIFAYTSDHLPGWNPISISGYHMGEAGATAVQEVAFTLANGIAYVEAAIAAGLKIDDFAPRLSFFFVANMPILQEVAKFRAARELWAIIMKERFGATNPKSQQLRFHTQTSGASLTAQQPNINIVRVTLQALAAILGGTQSLHTNSRDEALGLPTEESVMIALRTQQIAADETDVTHFVDPLAGSYVIEKLTAEIIEGAREMIARIDAMGGMVTAIEKEYPQGEIAESSYKHQRAVETGKEIVVGVNKFKAEEKSSMPPLRIDEGKIAARIQQFEEWKKLRDFPVVEAALKTLEQAARGTANLMPFILAAVEAYATVEEISNALGAVFGFIDNSRSGGNKRSDVAA